MVIVRAVALATLALVGAAGCGNDGLRTLTSADVTGLLPGDGFGTGFSGHYISIGRLPPIGCHCRSGSCPEFPQDGAMYELTATQSEGALSLASGTWMCAGGVDKNGRFACGSLEETADGHAYSLLSGRFGLIGVGVVDVVVHSEQTTVSTSAGLDCDFGTTMRLNYVRE